MSCRVEKGEIVYGLGSTEGETFTVTLLPGVAATFLITINVPDGASVFTVNVSAISALFTNKYFPHTSEPSTYKFVEIVDTQP